MIQSFSYVSMSRLLEYEKMYHKTKFIFFSGATQTENRYRQGPYPKQVIFELLKVWYYIVIKPS